MLWKYQRRELRKPRNFIWGKVFKNGSSKIFGKNMKYVNYIYIYWIKYVNYITLFKIQGIGCCNLNVTFMSSKIFEFDSRHFNFSIFPAFENMMVKFSIKKPVMFSYNIG